MSPAAIKTCRDFFRNDQGFLCYQYEGDALLRICVLKVSRDAVLHDAHGGALVGHPGITRTAVNVAQFFWWPNLFHDVVHFVHSWRTCATAKSSSGLRLVVDSFSIVCQSSSLHIGAWTSLALCPSLTEVTI